MSTTRNTEFPVRVSHTAPIYAKTARAAEILQLSPRTLEGWRTAGIGPCYSRSATGGILYRISDLVAFAETERVGTLDQAA